jgi:hypothetical protein
MRIAPVVALGLCLLATGCVQKWEPQYGPVPQSAAANQGSRVRLIMKQDGASVELGNMRVEGDSIVGEAGRPPQRIAVATEDVQVIAVSRADSASPVNTAITTVGVVLIVGLLAVVIIAVEFLDAIPD